LEGEIGIKQSRIWIEEVILQANGTLSSVATGGRGSTYALYVVWYAENDLYCLLFASVYLSVCIALSRTWFKFEIPSEATVFVVRWSTIVIYHIPSRITIGS
jgi:hypothetical protein